MNDKRSMYERFLDRIHKDKAGDAQVIIGGELFVLAIALLWSFFDSSRSVVYKIENYSLYLCIVIALSLILLVGVSVLIYGIVKKYKDRK